MLEAKLAHASTFKKIIEAIRENVDDANFEFGPSGLSLQCMDQAHVILTVLVLRPEGFENYRCDRTIPIGINLGSLAKVIRCAGNEDSITIRANDSGETINFIFESPKGERVSDYELKLLDLDVECVGVEPMNYDVVISMPSEELQRICRDLSVLSESVTISAIKDSVRFFAKGDMGNGSIVLRSGSMGSIDDREKGGSNASGNASSGPRSFVPTSIVMKQPVNLAVSLKFLSTFTKATGLSEAVQVQISENVPMVVEYSLGELGYLRYYLAPKIGEDEE